MLIFLTLSQDSVDVLRHRLDTCTLNSKDYQSQRVGKSRNCVPGLRPAAQPPTTGRFGNDLSLALDMTFVSCSWNPNWSRNS